MRRCPVCGDQLVRVEYEGANAMTCPECHGYLIDTSSAEQIKRSEVKSPQELKDEAQEQFHPNSDDALKCPRCRLSMKKVHESLPGVELTLDHCKSCSLNWLDGGELALLQLGYEGTNRATEARRIKDVSEGFESDPDRQAEFEENLSKCKKDNFSVADAICEGVVEGAVEGAMGRRSYGRADRSIIDLITSLF